MAETQITRCPHCQTTFRIRLEQLAKAKGAVRCGSCLQVFKAGDHFVSDQAVAKTAAKPAPKAAIKPAPKPAVKSQTTPKQTPKVAVKPTPKKSAEEISFDDIPDQIADDPLEDFGIRQPDRNDKETFDSSLQLDDSIFSMQENTKPSRFSLNNQGGDIDFDLDNNFADDFSNDNFGNDNFGSNNDNSDGLGNRELLYTNKFIDTDVYDISKDKQLRTNLSVRFSQAFDGYKWKQANYFLRQIDRRQGYAIGFAIHGEKNATRGFVADNYKLSYLYRANVYRKWLYFEVEPFLEWPEEENYSTTPGIALRVEGYFNQD